jgi:molecular chaperone DnaJ
MSTDPYEILGVSRDDDNDTIKSAYRRLALKYHPDRNPGDKEAEEKFKEITKAYEILSDPAKRRRFDMTGSADGMPDMGDFFGGFGLDDAMRAFQDIFGFGRSGGSTVTQGEDVVVDIMLELDEVVSGAKREITVKRNEHCLSCDGSGAHPEHGLETCKRCSGQGRIRTIRRTMLGTMQSVSTCPDCNGRGRLPVKPCPDCGGSRLEQRERTVSVDLPAGVSEGHFIRLRGQGHFPPDEGPPGDLILRIKGIDYGPFERDGFDLLYRTDISFPQAALGTSITIPAVEEESTEIDLPSGIQPGERLVIKRKGIKKLKGFGRGDIVVIPQVYVPQKLSRKEKSLLRELDGSDHFNPST